jgi:hypothetical protein
MTDLSAGPTLPELQRYMDESCKIPREQNYHLEKFVFTSWRHCEH